jgi:hypothetical protein
MSRTRGEIKALIEAHTGRKKEELENSLCDSALKMALLRHHFKDAQSQPDDFSIVEGETSVDISGTSGLVNIVTARIVESDGTRNAILPLRTRTWWDLHVVNAEDNMKGWPSCGMRWGSTILLDRPAKSGIKLRLRVTTAQTFDDDSTPCPISVLDVFVEHYVVAHIFKSIENNQAYNSWMLSALGARYLVNGEIGGELANAIEADSLGDTALDVRTEPARGALDGTNGGVSVKNMIAGHDDEGATRWWV